MQVSKKHSNRSLNPSAYPSLTMGYLDHAWEVAKMFRDPDYDYDPSDLGNFNLPAPNGGEG